MASHQFNNISARLKRKGTTFSEIKRAASNDRNKVGDPAAHIMALTTELKQLKEAFVTGSSGGGGGKFHSNTNPNQNPVGTGKASYIYDWRKKKINGDVYVKDGVT